jgi:peptidoglycan hydrolase-like protein with peptidoglycan-binding domain
VTESESEFDDPKKWNLSGLAVEAEAQAPVANNYLPPPPTLRLKSRGELVKKMQSGIGLKGADVDGFFGENTKKALQEFQKSHGLAADGICGAQTWDAIN